MTDPKDTRGARKLRAAWEAFALRDRVEGKRAIDVGASTGGFTATLLAHGAAHVTAVDVGHGQLVEALRQDARVELHERTDFRRASLSLAPGPFEFFVVDVSFVAARNMLRALAFRLVPGAEGIVLLKPQFELSKHEVRDGDVSDPKLRARAVALFTERAMRMGFEVLQRIDSPVPGESGTVEMLVHVRFAQRPEHFPAAPDADGVEEPGTREGEPSAKPQSAKPQSAKPQSAKPRRASKAERQATAADEELAWFAVVAPGLEPLAAAELGELPFVREARAVAGGVEFRGGIEAGYSANLGSRLATRVLLRLGEVKAREFAILRRKLSELPFEHFVDPARPVRIAAAMHHCRLHHTKALAEQLQLAIGDRLRTPIELAVSAQGESQAREDDEDARDEAEPLAESALPFGREPFARLLLRGQDDRFTISVDTSGLLLHRRGGRPEAGAAPMRETLAAAMLLAAGYKGDQPLVDAMCGAGTIALEAGRIALGQLPGAERAFALEQLPCVDAAQLAQTRTRLHSAASRVPAASITGFDRDRRAIERARRNAERSGLAAHIRFEAIDIRDARATEPAGLLLANPPYGRRLGQGGEAKQSLRALGFALQARWRDYRVAVLVPRNTPEAWLGMRVEERLLLRNGGFPVVLLVGRVA